MSLLFLISSSLNCFGAAKIVSDFWNGTDVVIHVIVSAAVFVVLGVAKIRLFRRTKKVNILRRTVSNKLQRVIANVNILRRTASNKLQRIITKVKGFK